MEDNKKNPNIIIGKNVRIVFTDKNGNEVEIKPTTKKDNIEWYSMDSEEGGIE